MLPIAYIGVFALTNRRDFLGEDLPQGNRRLLWNIAMALAIAAAVLSSAYYIHTKYIHG